MKLPVKRHEVIQPPDPSVRLIPLTKGQNALVDAFNYEWLMQWNWQAHLSPHTKTFYATRWEGSIKRSVAMHNIILGIPRGGDHIHNGETLDNRVANLRASTRSEER